MKIAPLADVKARFSKYIENLADGPVIVTKKGRAAAVLVSGELERFILAHTPKFRKLLDAAYARIQSTGGVKHKNVWK